MIKTWKVMADPINKGYHPYHDNRYIITKDTEVEISPYVPTDWGLSSGSIICRMNDICNQPEIAKLIAKAPETKEKLEKEQIINKILLAENSRLKYEIRKLKRKGEKKDDK